MDKHTCPKCGYTWLPRTEKPVECPNCKKRLWKYHQEKQAQDQKEGG